MSFTLYDLNEMYTNLIDLVESGASTEEELAEAIEQVTDEIENKADAYATIIKRFESNIDLIKDEKKRLSDKQITHENAIARLKSNLEYTMRLQDKPKFKTDRFSYNIQKNAPSVEITNEELITEDYIKVKKEIDKRAILAELKAGKEVAGAKLKQTESLRIR